MVERDYEWLDGAVVIFALVIVGFIAWSLVFRAIPENQLAVLASIASGIVGTVVGAYAGYRWTVSKQASDTIRDMARRSSDKPQEVEVVNTNDSPVPVQRPDPDEDLFRER